MSAACAASCATSGQVRRLEARLAAEQADAERRQAEDTTTIAALEAKLAALEVQLSRVTLADGRADAMTARLDALERRVAAAAPAVRPSRPAPDPALVYAIPVAGAPSKGPDDAPVTIVRAGEYACPYCEKVRATLDELQAIYGPKLRIVYRSYVVHPQLATLPAQAACAAHKQGRFWQLDALLWEKAFKTRQFDQANLDALAAEAGLDLRRFHLDSAGPCVKELGDERVMLERFGVAATPAFFINGRFLSGAQPTAAFQALIDEELAKAEGRMSKSRKRKGYYEQWVLGAGLPGLPGLVPAGPQPAPMAAPAAP
ncbi:MAG TPA: thioredoxin domain-containing protein [Kofleriaceae bacterium]|nr:thioredoxin domain-containing protein [Kofleriaceae bacterium]